MIDIGTVKPGRTVRFPFGSYTGSTGASSAVTNFADADILVYKDGSATQRSSASGITATTSFDSASLVGINLISIDLADNADAGFYSAGSEYLVLVGPVTVDSQTVYFPAGRFTIGLDNAVLNTTIATLASQVSFTLTLGPAEDDALNGCIVYIHDVASAVQGGYAIVDDYTGASKTVTLKAGTTFTAAATDNIMVFHPFHLPYGAVPAVLAGAAGGLFLAGTNAPVTITGSGNALTLTSTGANGQGLIATGNGSGAGGRLVGGATGNGLEAVGNGTDGSGASLTGAGTGSGLYAEGGATGIGLSAFGGGTSGAGALFSAQAGNSDGATFTKAGAGADINADITGDITGNLSGSAGSVAGAVGSVTGSVGSVAGNVAGNVNGNVVGSTGSVAGNVAGNVVGNVNGNVVGSVGALAVQAQTDVRTAVGLAAADLDTQLAGIAGDIAALNDLSAAQVLTQMNSALDAVLADSIPADGALPSLRQAIYMGIQFLVERSVVGTTLTVRKVNGSTALFTCTLDSAVTPTSITRAT